MKKLLLLTAFLFGTLLQAQTTQERIDQAKTYIKGNNWSYAKIELKHALKADPDNVDANYLMAQAWFKTGGFHLADEILEKLLQNDPNNPNYLWLRVRSNLHSHSTPHHFEKALAALTKLQSDLGETADIKEAFGLAYYHYGHYQYSSKKYSEAIALFENSATNLKKAVTQEPGKEPELRSEIADSDQYIIEIKKKL